MTLTYPISQCIREVEAWVNTSHIKHKTSWYEYARQCLTKWEQRLEEAINTAILLNHSIICQWGEEDLMDVIQQGHNPYMVIAALMALTEDMHFMSEDDLVKTIELGRNAHFKTGAIIFTNRMQDEVDHRLEMAQCPDCQWHKDDCTCPDPDYGVDNRNFY